MLLVLVFRLLAELWLHPFHVSVCEIKHNAQAQSLEITHRIFLDDLEETLRLYSGNEKLDVLKAEDRPTVHLALKEYLSENFEVSVNGRKLEYTYLGEETEDDLMWIYVEVAGVAEVDYIEIDNKLLTEVFSDQMNLVHVYARGKTRSMRLKENSTWGQIVYQ